MQSLRSVAEFERGSLRLPLMVVVGGPGGRGGPSEKDKADARLVNLARRAQLEGCRICTVLASVSNRVLHASGVNFEEVDSLEAFNSRVLAYQDKVKYVVAPCTASSDPTCASLELSSYNFVRTCALQVAQLPFPLLSTGPLLFVDGADLDSFLASAPDTSTSAAADGGEALQLRLASKCLSACSQRDQALSAKLFAFAPKTVLVMGSGGREHAMAVALAKSSQVSRVLVSPGNGGTALAGGKISNVAVPGDNASLVAYAQQNSISLVAVGPEQPLVDGLVDAMDQAGIPCFGPSQQASQLEASKAYSKDFMQRHGIRTATYRNFTDFAAAKAYLESPDCPARVVVKASGLAAGKGVLIPENREAAVAAARSIMVDQVFGGAGLEVVIEEFLEGEELSLLAFCDGKTAVPMPGAQDHKRVFDKDQGPNTGGMGAYAPAPILTPGLLADCMAIVQVTVDKMREEGRPYKGVLYAGFMICKSAQGWLEPVVLEYNCRFGDPETQVLLPLLESDLYDIMLACSQGRLTPGHVIFSKKSACTVVCAAPGYPNSYPKGSVITGLGDAVGCRDVTVFHAGSTVGADGVTAVTSGGRVLAVTGMGDSLRGAVDAAYKGVAAVSFPGMHCRSDIAARGLDAPLVLGVIGSTRGTDMQAVIDAIESGKLRARIALVVSNMSQAGILERATKHNIPNTFINATGLTREEYDCQVCAAFESAGVQLVLMIGYMRIVSPLFIARYRDRCMNVHPSLLPDFAGGMDLQVHADVIKAGKKESGCTVHFVTEEVDGGPIVVQEKCIVSADETPDSLKAKVQVLEGAAFVKAIEMFRAGVCGPGHHREVITYRAAGVDIDAGEDLVEAIKPMCKATRRPGCDADLGGFGGLFDLSAAGYNSSETVLVSGTDGVGTKLKIAHAVGIHDTIGIDLVAMCVNDILVCGAEPLFFLDYYATGALEVPTAALVVKGIAEGCRQSGSALIGGETAEMAGMYAKGEYDLAGFSVGAVKKQDILPQGVGAGDVLIGLRSSGVHSNGFSLVRKCVEKSGLAWTDAAPFDPSQPLGRALLTPTRIYVSLLLPLVKAGLIKGMAHITGGGLLDNLPRVLPDGIEAVIEADKANWSLPPVFKWLQSISNLPQHELLRTFNCGIGMVVVVGADKAARVNQLLAQGGESDYFANLGYLRAREGSGPQVVVQGEVN